MPDTENFVNNCPVLTDDNYAVWSIFWYNRLVALQLYHLVDPDNKFVPYNVVQVQTKYREIIEDVRIMRLERMGINPQQAPAPIPALTVDDKETGIELDRQISMMLSTLSPEKKQSVRRVEEIEAVWEILWDAGHTLSIRNRRYSEFVALGWKEKDTMETFAARVKEYWLKQGGLIDDQQIIHKLWTNLPPAYFATARTIRDMTDLQAVLRIMENDATILKAQEENTDGGVALAANASQRGRGKGRGRGSGRGRIERSRSRENRSKSRENRQSRFDGICLWCNRYGHPKRDCRHLQSAIENGTAKYNKDGVAYLTVPG